MLMLSDTLAKDFSIPVNLFQEAFYQATGTKEVCRGKLSEDSVAVT